MELFDKKYVYFMWDDELEDKKVFASNNIYQLIVNVDTNNDGCLRENFIKEEFDKQWWKFVYYDPNYDVKWGYYKENKKVQAKLKDFPKAEWKNIERPQWESNYEWRIQPEENYRIEPEKAYRPYKNLTEYMLDRSNFEFVITMNKDAQCFISGLKNNSVFILDKWYTFTDLFNQFTFLDGSPCGVEE